MKWLYLIPKNLLSFIVGRLVKFKLPRPLGPFTVRWFAHRYKINMSEAEFPIEHYRTIGSLFTRRLKSGVRPIHNGVVHPVDARITSWGTIHSQTLIQAKGHTYKLSEFIGSHLCPSDELLKEWEGGTFITYYLCPTDYHRIHAAVDGDVTEIRYLPGQLWPVNDWSVQNIKNLFSINERILTVQKFGQSHVGTMMVGATNVGSMSLSFDAAVMSNHKHVRNAYRRAYEIRPHLSKGDHLGTFHMGSTVIMLFPKNAITLSNDPTGPVKMGETLAE